MSWFTWKLLYIRTLQFTSNSQKERVKEVVVKKLIQHISAKGTFVCVLVRVCVCVFRDVIFLTLWDLLDNIHKHKHKFKLMILKCERIVCCHKLEM